MRGRGLGFFSSVVVTIKRLIVTSEIQGKKRKRQIVRWVSVEGEVKKDVERVG